LDTAAEEAVRLAEIAVVLRLVNLRATAFPAVRLTEDAVVVRTTVLNRTAFEAVSEKPPAVVFGWILVRALEAVRENEDEEET
jgi:hypothetical protein